MKTELDISNLSADEIHSKFRLTREEYLKLDDTEFRARFRERLHHTLEINTYEAIHSGRKLSLNQTNVIKELIDIWRQKRIPEDLPDFMTALIIIEFAEAAQNGIKVDLSKFAPHKITEEEYKAYDHIIKERRSVRHWTDKEVPDTVIDKVLESGLWAAHSCNLQSIRYAVIREKNMPGLFRGSDIPGGPVHLVVLQDYRVYRANPLNPERNRLLDAGAATQNLVLTAHALGLGGVWLTFNDKMLERLKDFLKIPEYIKVTTYVDIGYPAQTPAPTGRITLDEAVIARI